ncbi:hypothetical protein AMS68_000661 [Peltaster fructicola]|uniref:MIF4G domain-containing protein n=1 Tax=Peltaster fructicola TaxID=286661 RepID=A0A6H0XK92_9PEZI|nr:hypothetical protein AMS68_000661 [Peltaster fructicola]
MSTANAQLAQPAVPVNNSDSSSAATSGSVPAQQPARSYASATKTASAQSANTPSSHHAQDSSMNGSMTAQGSVQPAINGNIPNGTSDHSRKPSVVISASGASGHIPNGGPVGQSARPPISFGMNPNQVQDQSSSLPAPSDNPRVISPAHSPSPIPHPATSGGRPPSSLQSPGNGPAFGSISADASAQPSHFNPAHMHERRPSSQSMQSGDSNMGRNYPPQAGRGRGGYPQQYGQMGSPAQGFRQLSNPGRPGMNNQFSSGNVPQNAQFRPPNRQQSPAIGHVQPQNPYSYGAYPAQGMYPPEYNAYGGYYQPYGYAPQFGSPGQSGSPRPQYPNVYTPGQGQAPFMPPNMARTPSQASDRPGSSIGHPGTPSQAHVAPSQSGSVPPAASQSNFVRPKKSSAIKITNDKGETINFAKPAATSTPSASTPVIAHTPSAPTPPPRTPSAQPAHHESKSAMSQDETREAFKRQVEEKRRQEESAKVSTDTKPAEPAAAKEVVKQAEAEAEKAAAVAADDKEGEKAAEAEVKSTGETDEERQKREEQEEEDRLIAEMEAAEKEEEEREKAFQAKRKLEKEAAAKKEAEKAANADEDLKRQEREAEARELERERERDAEKKTEEPDEDAKALFASLKKPTLGPGANAEQETAEEAAEEPESAPETTVSRSSAAQKPKPAHLKLETNRKVEPAEPTPGMQALKSARFLEIKEEALYPQGIRSPNPALNANGAKRGRAYDKDFLLQFQSVFKEKPSVDWDQKVRDTLGPGDEPGSARPQSARTPSGAAGRSTSSRGVPAASSFGGPMGSFGGAGQGRTLPAGTTSQERFLASSRGMGMPGQMNRVPNQLGMGAQNMGLNRTNSLQHMGPGSPRQPSSRGGKGASKRGDRAPSKKEEAEMAARMPLTASGEVKALEKSTTGWKASSITGGPMANAPSLDGHMAPDMVQRKVKAALNKMTPEKFDKISDQILDIASQSKNETDGRTLRQVIQLTFEKACDEAHWAQMYAQFCHKMLTAMSQEIRDETIKDKSGAPVVGGALFRKYLLNRCQEEFERGWQVNLPDKPEGETEEAALLSDEYYIAAAAKRKGLGLIAFIGQLYKLNMLTSRIMHECVLRLLNFEGAPDESAIETLTTLLKSVGSTMDADQQGHALVDTYFQRIDEKILADPELPSRPRFMILDLMDLRRAKWQGKDNLKGPKTISEIHAEAEAAQAKAEMERQRSRAGAGRPPGGRQDSRNFSGQMAPPPVDYSRTNVSSDDMKRLQNRAGSHRSTGGGLGPGGSLGPSGLGLRAGSRRGNLGPGGSGNSTRTSTPPVGDKDKKEEPAQQNSFSALENLDTEETESPEASRDRSKSPLPESKADDA